jgi:predicted RNase H-like nuclease
MELMPMPARTHGPTLPYTLIAGVVPHQPGWLIVSAKLQGATMAPEAPRVLGCFADVLDDKPAHAVIALFAPVGLLDKPDAGGRECERAARALLGRRRGAAIRSAPSWLAINGIEPPETLALDAVTAALLPHYAEVASEMAPYRQRTVYEVHPELSFFQLNDDQPLESSKRSAAGRSQRRELLERRIPGVERLLDASLPGIGNAQLRQTQLLDATACLWTARRVLARAVTRLPADPVWDSQGLRMEIVR